MADINQNVNINVNADTQNAGQDIEKLEKNISTLDGVINIVGGSVEVLAGSLALTGAVSEETAAKFEAQAVGAIALADGSKRIIEGYKTLAKETKVLTVIQRIYNAVLSANPIFIIVGILAAVVVGVIALTASLKAQREEQEKLNKAQADKNALRFNERNLELLKIRGATAKEVADEEVRLAKIRNKDAQKEFLALKKGQEGYDDAQEAYRDANDALIIARAKAKKASEDEIEETRLARIEYESTMQVLKQTSEEVVRSLRLFSTYNPLDEPLEKLE